MRSAALLLLASLLLPAAALALPVPPSIPNPGQAGHAVTDLPPFAPSEISDAAAGGPGEHGSHPHDGTPPYGNAYGYGRGNGNTPSVPEPAAALLLGAGLVALRFAGRRRA